MNNEFIESMIYEIEKDNTFNNSYDFCKRIREKYKLNYHLGNLYKKIINYQIDKYGCSLQYLDDRYNIEELRRIGRNAKERRHARRNKKIRS